MTPTVSVVIPCYNYAHYLSAALNSVLDQTYTAWEAIVVDDGSTDNTCEIATGFRDPRIHYMCQENQGESVARNRGAGRAQGRYLALLDADDIWLPQKLVKQISLMEENPDIGVAYSGVQRIDQQGNLLAGGRTDADSTIRRVSIEDLFLQKTTIAAGSTAVIRKSVWEKIGGFDPEIQFGEDWCFCLRAALVTEIAGLPEPLVRVRVHREGQWRFPNASTADQVLEDHLRLLHRCFSLWSPDGALAQGLRRRAIANEYAKSAFTNYALGRPHLARDQLQEALDRDREAWSVPTRLADRIAQKALTLAQMHPTEPGTVETYVTTVLDHLPADLSGLLAPRLVKARANIDVGYYFSACGRREKARHHILQGLWLDPTWFSNRGTLALALELTLGKQPVQVARRLLGRRDTS